MDGTSVKSIDISNLIVQNHTFVSLGFTIATSYDTTCPQTVDLDKEKLGKQKKPHEEQLINDPSSRTYRHAVT